MGAYLPISVFVRVAGSLGPAALLQHLRFLHQNASFEKDGKLWHARGSEDLASGAGLTAKQYRTAMEKLIKSKLVERRHGPHPTRPGKLRVTWFRLTEEAEEALTMKFTPATVKAANSKSKATEAEDETPTPAQKGVTNHAHTGSINHAPQGAILLEGKKSKEEKQGSNSFAALAASYEEDERPEKVAIPAEFRELWVWWQRKLHPNVMVPSFTHAEWGIVKNYLKRCKEMGADPRELTDKAVGQWSDAAFHVQKAANLHLSAAPSLPSLLKGAHALHLWAVQLTAKKTGLPPKKMSQMSTGSDTDVAPPDVTDASPTAKFKKLTEKKL